jgi:hypothetical protein
MWSKEDLPPLIEVRKKHVIKAIEVKWTSLLGIKYLGGITDVNALENSIHLLPMRCSIHWMSTFEGGIKYVKLWLIQFTMGIDNFISCMYMCPPFFYKSSGIMLINNMKTRIHILHMLYNYINRWFTKEPPKPSAYFLWFTPVKCWFQGKISGKLR